MPETILVVDDEPRIVEIVEAYLRREGYTVLVAGDGQTALDMARRTHPDLVVLDLMLPRLSGLEITKALRSAEGGGPPIIMLTARDDVTDRIVGLELGADDYVTKPFNARELAARVRAVLRRGARPGHTAPAPVNIGNLTVDESRHEARLNGELLPLTPTEFAILATLASEPGRAFSRQQLMERSQSDALADYEGLERAIDSHVKNLRQKLEPDPRHPKYIQTVFGIGYKMVEKPD